MVLLYNEHISLTSLSTKKSEQKPSRGVDKAAKRGSIRRIHDIILEVSAAWELY